MLCVALLIVVTSLFDGFVAKYLESQQRFFGEITLTPPRAMTGYVDLADRLSALPEVAVATPVARTGGLLYLGRGDVRGVQLLGIDLAARCQDEEFAAGLVLQKDASEPSFALPEAVRERARSWLERKLRREVADDDLPTGAILGIGVLVEPDDLTDAYDVEEIRDLLADRSTGMSITAGRIVDGADGRSAVRRTGVCWPVDVVETGLDEADTSHVYLPFDYVADLIGTSEWGKPSCIAQIHITLAEGYSRGEVIQKVRAAWQIFARENLGWDTIWANMVVIESQDESRWAKLLTYEIQKQLRVMQMILGLICLVVIVLVFVVLFMIVLQRRRDIGIVRSVGSSRWGVAMVFIGYGGAIGLVGAVLGLILGAWATKNITMLEGVLTRILGFKVWRSGVYMLREIPNEISWGAVWWIMLAGVLAAVVGALLPAVKAARMQPASALRYE